MKKSLLLLLSLLLVTLLLTACGRSTPVSYYMLESLPMTTRHDALPAVSLRVGKVHVAGYLDRQDIVRRHADRSQLGVARFHAWAEPLPDGVARLTQEVLTGPLLDKGFNVLAPSDDARDTFVLLLDIMRLDGDFAGTARLQARWTLLDSDNRVLKRGIFVDEEKVRKSSYESLVTAQSLLVRRMAEHLATTLPPLMLQKR